MTSPTSGTTEAYPLRMTPQERDIVRTTASDLGCSMNTAIRLLIRRGRDWTPVRPTPATAPPDARGQLVPLMPVFREPIPGQTSITLED